jgi:hypothetical protein
MDVAPFSHTGRFHAGSTSLFLYPVNVHRRGSEQILERTDILNRPERAVLEQDVYSTFLSFVPSGKKACYCSMSHIQHADVV